MSSSYNTPCSKHKLVVSIYSNTETSLAMSTLAIWCRVVRSRDVRSRDFSAPMSTASDAIVNMDSIVTIITLLYTSAIQVFGEIIKQATIGVESIVFIIVLRRAAPLSQIASLYGQCNTSAV